MSYQVFARKTRPRNFSEVIGQSHVLQALSNGLDANRVHHAFLFTGTRGVGKTTIARIFSKALNCEKGVSASPCGECASCVDIDEGRFVDLIEIDAASRTGVDDIRELIENVQYAPTRGRHKVYLIDEVHMLSNSAFNALLKTLEEPPEHVKFLLATTDPQKIPVTVLSRCLQFNLRRLDAAEIKVHLANVLNVDGVEFEVAALGLIARAADGSVRDSLSLLDQAMNFGGGRLLEADTRSMLGTVDETRVVALFEAVIAGDAAVVFDLIEVLQNYGFDWKASLGELALLCQRMAVYQQAPQALADDTPAIDAIRDLSPQITAADVQLYYQIAVAGLRDMDYAPEPRSGFEMVILRMLAFRPATVVAAPERSSVTTTASPASVSQHGVAAVPVSAPGAAATPAEDSLPTTPVVDAPISKPLSETVSEPEPAAVADVVQGAASTTTAPAPQMVSPPLSDAVGLPNGELVNAAQAPVAAAADISDLDWAVFAASLPLKGMLVALAENTTVLNKDANKLSLGVNSAMAAVCPDGVRQRFVELIQQHLPGIEISVTLIAEGDAAAAATPAAKAAEAEVQRQDSAHDSVARDPNVKQLLSEFDGKIEPNSIKPVTSETLSGL